VPATPLVDRLLLSPDLWAAGVALRRQHLRRRYPDASETEIDRLLAEWLRQRPGAQAGGGPQPGAP
jgi:hypothetical protein